jgi:class 3 adenylate cyclase
VLDLTVCAVTSHTLCRCSRPLVVTMLNDIFSRFDYLVGIYDLNKVKTIGDCYMVTSIPSDKLEHDGCARVCRFALDLLKAVRDFNNTAPQHGPINFRIGVATGSVVAGVVGTKRFLFDMWGDAVNIAARMVRTVTMTLRCLYSTPLTLSIPNTLPRSIECKRSRADCPVRFKSLKKSSLAPEATLHLSLEVL